MASDDPFNDPAVKEIEEKTLQEYNPFDSTTSGAFESPPRDAEFQVYETPTKNLSAEFEANSDSPIEKRQIISTHNLGSERSIVDGRMLDRMSELDQRERELKQKEMELALRTEDFEGRLSPDQNWPFSFWAILYHDIEAEVPFGKQEIVKSAYRIWRLTSVALFLNLLNICIYWWSPGLGCTSCTTEFFFALLYFILGVYLGWHLWYKKLYDTCRQSKTMKWLMFFLNFAIHTGFCLVMAIGIPGTSASGLLVMFDMFAKDNALMGVLFVISTLMWALTCGLSVLLFKKVHRVYYSTGAANQTSLEMREGISHRAVDIITHTSGRRTLSEELISSKDVDDGGGGHGGSSNGPGVVNSIR